jgi:SAM-dependent methyltransferase
VYRFLSMISAHLDAGETLTGKTILECGAGGRRPPLALFAQHGLTAFGVDIDREQVERARRFCEENGIRADFREADMRELPFADASFDYVYEHFSICHLSPQDAAQAVAEMRRVLKPGGLAFVGFLSRDTWPLSSYGVERDPGVYSMTLEGGEELRHTMLADSQADALVADWGIVRKDKLARVDLRHGEEVSRDEWQALYTESRIPCTPAKWMARYPERANHFTDVYAYYTLQKPSE